MKKNLIRLISFVLVFCFFVPASTVFAADLYGMEFNDGDEFAVVKKLSVPLTVEATVELPRNFDGRAGVIIGNYTVSKIACFNFEITTDGNPRFYVTDNNTTTYDVTFKNVDLRDGKPVHIAIAYDKTTKKLTAYKNGVAAQTINREIPLDIKMDTTYRLGGDRRQGNAQYFKGVIYDLAFWSTTRTASQIKTDMDKIDGNATSLIGAWDMNKLKRGDPTVLISDISPNKNDIKYKDDGKWVIDGGYKGEYAYSFAVIGDTQIVTEKAPDKLHLLYDWIVENAEAKNTKFVIGLGDITNRTREWEWTAAKDAITRLNGVVPYSIVRGNHDDITDYKNAFPMSEFKKTITGSLEGDMLNTYHKFEVGAVKYLIVNLDLKYNQKQLDWANQLIADNPDRNVILTSHILLTADGTMTADAKKYGAKFDPLEVWDLLIKKHENIVMFICGHSPTDKIVVSTNKGDNGNTVKLVLIDPQGMDASESLTGLVATFYFSEDGRKVYVDYYSPLKKKYRANTKVSFSLDVLPVPEAATTAPPETTAAPDTDSTATESGCGAAIGGTFVVLTSILGTAWVSKRH